MLAHRPASQLPRLLPGIGAACTLPGLHAAPWPPPPRLERLQQRARPFFDTAQALIGRLQATPPPEPAPCPVVLLSGFLGAGKTTVLEQLLHQQHGFKLGVIVNDLASVNVDAHVLQDAIKTSGAQSVSLENGCVCCTAADDLRESVQSLRNGAEGRGLDAIVVELSGVAEPARVKQMLEVSVEPTGPPQPVRTVTVVDSPAFATDYLRERTSPRAAAQRVPRTASGELGDERYGTLLAEQVEGADLLLLNKADLATKEEIAQTHAMVKALNETATIRTTEHGKVEVDELLAIKLARTDAQDADRGGDLELVAESAGGSAAAVKACCAAKTCSTTNEASTKACKADGEAEESRPRAETRFGISSFVYSTERLMSRAKLMMRLGEWQKARDHLGNTLSLTGDGSIQGLTEVTTQAGTGGTASGSPLAPILRSKGILLLDANPAVAFYWSHAGKSVNFSVFGPWPENISQAKGGFGAKRTELVFIGAGYDETAIRGLLDSCLVSDDELRHMNAVR